MRVQQNTSVAVLTESFDDTPSSVSATVTSARTGAALSPAPTATIVGNRVKLSLTAADHTASLDKLIVAVSATVDSLATKQTIQVDVVGSHYCTIGALREEPKLDDKNRFPDALIAEIRDEVESYVEQAAGISFVPTFGSERHIGDAGNNIVLRHNAVRSLVSVTVDGTAQNLSNLELLDGDQLYARGGFPFISTRPVVVKLEHGEDRPPVKLVREVKKAIRSELLSRGAQAPRDLLWEQTADGNTVRYSTPDFFAGRFTGNLSLDAAINAYRSVMIGFA